MGNIGSGESLDAMVLRRQSLVSQRMFRALGRWTLDDVVRLKHRFNEHRGHLGLTRSELGDLLSFKQPSVDSDVVFSILDHDHNGRVDGLEFLSALAVCCDGDELERVRFCFELCDFNYNGYLNQDETTLMMRSTISGLHKLFGDTNEPPPDSEFVKIATAFFKEVDVNADDKVKIKEFYQWYKDNREVFDRIHTFQKRAARAARDVPSDDSASEAEDSGDEDIQAEGEQPERSEQQEAANLGMPLAASKEDPFAGGPAQGDEFMAVKPWLGAIKEPTSFRKEHASSEAPSANLELEWVHGYRGFDCRGNIAVNKEGRIVFTAAALGVVMGKDEGTQRFYAGHTDDIISFAMHKNGALVATGQLGARPTIHLWDSVTMENVATLSGFHKRGVSQLAFSHDGTKLASIGLDNDHSVAVYDVKTHKLIASSKGDPGKLLALAWTKDNSAIVACGIKVVKFFTINGRSLKAKKGLLGRKGKIQPLLSIGFASDDVVIGTASGHLYRFSGRHLSQVVPANDSKQPVYVIVSDLERGGLISGSKDGSVCVWGSNLKLAHTLSVATGEVGSLDPGVRAIAVMRGSFVVGTRGCEILEVDRRTGEGSKLLQGHFDGELWGLAAHPLRPAYFSCGDDKTLREWDVVLKRMVHAVELPEKARALAVAPDASHIAVGMWSGTVTVLQSGSFARVAAFNHAREWIEDMCYSPDGSMLAVTSHDNNIYLYRVKGSRYAKCGVCRGHTSYVTHVDWSRDSKVLQTNCGAYELLFWDCEGNQIRSATSVRDVDWASWTCVLGWPVQGIWPPTADGTDINAVDRSSSGKLLATADDFGQVKLFRYPCLDKGAAYNKFHGHSSHVTNVRFTVDDGRVLTAGGNDKCLFQWRVQEEEEEAAEAVEEEEDSTRLHELSNDGSAPLRTAAQEARGVAIAPGDVSDEDDPFAGGPAEGDEFMAVKPWLGAIRPMKRYENKMSRLKGDEPDASLSLDWVHGYRGWDCRNNLRYAHSGAIVYHAAAVGVVYDVQQGVQRFHAQHTDDILSLTMHPAGNVVATGEVGRKPKIMVWDAQNRVTLAVLEGFHRRGVTLLAFVGSEYLASVGLDDDHSVAVYNWKQKRLVASAKGNRSKVLGLSGSVQADGTLSLVTCGVKHVKFWTLQGSSLKGQKGIFGKAGKIQTMVAVEHCGSVAVTGAANGDLCVWKGHTLSHVLPEAHKGMICSLHWNGDKLATGGDDGIVRLWNPSAFVDPPSKAAKKKGKKGVKFDVERGAGEVTEVSRPDGLFHECVRSVFIKSDQQRKAIRVLVGTRGGEIFESVVSQGVTDSRVLSSSHCLGELWGLVTNPINSSRYFTCGDDGTLREWDASSHRAVSRTSVHDDLAALELKEATGRRTLGARACAMSPDGKHVAVATNAGAIVIYDNAFDEREGGSASGEAGAAGEKVAKARGASALPRLRLHSIIAEEGRVKQGGLRRGQVPSDWVQELKFAPAVAGEGDEYRLAVGSHDNRIYVYRCPEGAPAYAHEHTLSAHTSYITHLDFSDDGSLLQSNCGAYELLFWDVTTGERLLHASSDRLTQERWASWTCVLGWPVQGIWPPTADGTDINAVDRSHYSIKGPSAPRLSLAECKGNDPVMTLATADDFGRVSLFKYPCIAKRARSAAFCGHSSHVTNVRFTADDKFLISTGGNDRCVFQWETADVHWQGSPNDDAATEMSQQTTASEAQERDEIINEEFGLEGSDPFAGGPAQGDEFMAVKPWLGAIKEPTSFRHDPSMDEAPRESLELEWVHGYRGWDCRNNLRYNADGGVVFHTAAVGVVMEVESHRQHFHFGHRDDIVGFAMHPEGYVVATGEMGRKPRVILWDVHSGNTLQVIQGFHRRAVRLLAFSPSGEKLVTIGDDDDHSVAVYRVADGALLASSKGDKNRVLDVAFSLDGHTLVTVGVRHVRFWAVSGRTVSSKKGIMGRKGDPRVAKTCVAFVRGQTLTGQADGSLYLWGGRTVASKHAAHKGGVRALCVLPGGDSFLSAGADGRVLVWDQYMTHRLVVDLRKGPLVGQAPSISSLCWGERGLLVGTRGGEIFEVRGEAALEGGGSCDRLLESHYRGELWGLAPFSTGSTFVSAGDDGTVRLWDAEARHMAALREIPDGKARAVAVSPRLRHVAVGLSTAKLLVFDSNLEGELTNQQLGRGKQAVSVVRYSSDGGTLAVGSHDNNIYLFNTSPYVVRAVCKGHNSYITHLDFSADGAFLQSNCGAYELLFWSVSDGSQMRSASALRDTKWATSTCTLGFPVQGIWPPESDGTDVNAVDRSNSNKLLATADDFGKVKLFKYPCVTAGAKYRSFEGHSSHVTNAAFTPGDKHLISAGGNDKSLFQWRVKA